MYTFTCILEIQWCRLPLGLSLIKVFPSSQEGDGSQWEEGDPGAGSDQERTGSKALLKN